VRIAFGAERGGAEFGRTAGRGFAGVGRAGRSTIRRRDDGLQLGAQGADLALALAIGLALGDKFKVEDAERVFRLERTLGELLVLVAHGLDLAPEPGVFILQRREVAEDCRQALLGLPLAGDRDRIAGA